MGVRSGLPIRIHTRAAMLNKGRLCADLSPSLHRQCGDASAAIICDQHTFATCIECQMARASPARWLLIDELQVSAFRFYRPGAYSPCWLILERVRFPNRVKNLTHLVQSEERWVLCCRRQFRPA